MRNFYLIFAAFLVVGLAYWAYTENYKTQAAQKRINALSTQIAEQQEAIAILEAEWAYLNRPERLRELADMNFERLNLVPLAAQHFSEVDQVAFPPRDPLADFNAPVEAQNDGSVQ